MPKKKKVAEPSISSELASRLTSAISATQVVEVLRQSTEGNSIKLLFRVSHKKLWLSILEFVLLRARTWSAHICQQYFVKDGKLVYGWNFILRPNESVDAAAAVAEAEALFRQGIQASQRTQEISVDSFPLVGASPRRTAKIVFDPRAPGPSRGGPSHKGAYPVGGDF
jgi:hypothetical protein